MLIIDLKYDINCQNHSHGGFFYLTQIANEAGFMSDSGAVTLTFPRTDKKQGPVYTLKGQNTISFNAHCSGIKPHVLFLKDSNFNLYPP